MNEVHFVMQGKGGVGKSYTALHLAQFLRNRDPESLTIDTDPLTPTLFHFKGLDPAYIAISDESQVHLEKFDRMMELLASTHHDAVIDTGASTFLPLSQYMMENHVLDMLTNDFDKVVYIHVVLSGKTEVDLCSTTYCLDCIAEQFSEKARLIVWLNHFGGDIPHFESSAVYLRHAERIEAVITIRDPTSTELKDIVQMHNQRIIYREIKGNADFSLMSKSRLYRIEKEILGQLTGIYSGGIPHG